MVWKICNEPLKRVALAIASSKRYFQRKQIVSAQTSIPTFWVAGGKVAVHKEIKKKLPI